MPARRRVPAAAPELFLDHLDFYAINRVFTVNEVFDRLDSLELLVLRESVGAPAGISQDSSNRADERVGRHRAPPSGRAMA